MVTPANHFVSEQIVESIARFERGEIGREDVLNLISRMDQRSFDPQQQKFFGAVRKLVDRVAEAPGGTAEPA